MLCHSSAIAHAIAKRRDRQRRTGTGSQAYGSSYNLKRHVGSAVLGPMTLVKRLQR